MSKLHFILSAPRSGSTWLARSLNHHPEVFATEHRLFGDFCEIWPNNDGTHSPRITFDAYAEAFAMHYMFGEMQIERRQFIDSFQRSFVNFLMSYASRRTKKSTIVDKVTPYLGTCQTVLDQIKRLLPDSQIIWLVRDGRDVLTSGTFDWVQRESKDSIRYRYLVSQEMAVSPDRFFDDAVIQQWAEHWREVGECALQANLVNPVRYEEMKRNHSVELQRLFKELKVNCDAQIAESCADATTFKKTTGRDAGDSQPTAKARKGISGDWKNYFTRQDGELFHKIAGELLVKLGYEASDAWIQELPETLPSAGNQLP